MNERIFELEEQAFEETVRVMGSTVLPEAFDDYYTEKFAELIVRECSLTIWQNIVEAADSTRLDTAELETHLYKKWDQQIKQHFGVEE